MQLTITGKVDHHFDGEDEHDHCEVWPEGDDNFTTLDDLLLQVDGKRVKVTIEVLS